MIYKKPLRKILGIGASALLTTGLLITSQNAEADFYDGQRGPGIVQVDQIVNYDNDLSTATFFKLFGEDRSSIDPGFIGKYFTKGGETTGFGFNVIGLIDDPLGHGEHVRMVPGIQVDRDLKGDKTVISPSFASTIKIGKSGKGDFVTIDPRASYRINLNGEDEFVFGGTVGIGNEKYRAGVDFSGSSEKKPEYRGIVRIDNINEDGFHSWWVQGYVGEDNAGIGIRFNW